MVATSPNYAPDARRSIGRLRDECRDPTHSEFVEMLRAARHTNVWSAKAPKNAPKRVRTYVPLGFTRHVRAFHVSSTPKPPTRAKEHGHAIGHQCRIESQGLEVLPVRRHVDQHQHRTRPRVAADRTICSSRSVICIMKLRSRWTTRSTAKPVTAIVAVAAMVAAAPTATRPRPPSVAPSMRSRRSLASMPPRRSGTSWAPIGPPHCARGQRPPYVSFSC